MKCPRCKKENPIGSKFCESCGMPLNQQVEPIKQKNYLNIVFIIVIFLFITVVGLVCVMFLNRNTNMTDAEHILENSTEKFASNINTFVETVTTENTTTTDLLEKSSQENNNINYENDKYLPETLQYSQNYNFNSATASSYLGNQGSHSYYPINAIDGNIKTAWVEGVSGKGENEWLEIRSNNIETIHKIGICNGYRENSVTYKENGKVKTALLEFSDGTSITINFNSYDEDGFTYFDVGEIDTSFIRITLLSCESGSKYDDICISEVKIY